MTGPADLTLSETVERAEQLLLDGRDAENLEFLEDAIERFPQDPEVRLLYGTALVPFRPEEAPWQLATAIKLDMDNPWRLTRDPGSLSVVRPRRGGGVAVLRRACRAIRAGEVFA